MRMVKLLTITILMMGSAFAFASLAEAKGSKSAENFVQNAAISGNFEVMSSKLALDKSKNADVKQFAQHMIDDHSKINKQLKEIVPSSSVAITLVTDTIDSKHQKRLDKLSGLSGKDFDSRYINEQIAVHEEVVKLFTDYSKKGKDPILKDFAAQTLPTLQQYQQDAMQLKSSYKK